MNQNLQYLQNITDGLRYMKVPNLLPVACLALNSVRSSVVIADALPDIKFSIKFPCHWRDVRDLN